MRTAFNFKVLGALILAAPAVLGGASAAYASDIPNPPSAPALSGTPMTASEPGSMEPASVAPQRASNLGLQNAENKIPDTVKDVMKRLDKPTDEVTLDDINSARQAVAKIEVLIDIEKHLAELDKVRHERAGGTAMANMIPASALAPPMYTPPQMGGGMPQVASINAPMMQPLARESAEITQISGGDGHYVASIKVSGEEAKSFHVGDKLSDGSVVTSISPSEVVFDRNGTKHSLHVKNIDTVFSNSF